MPAVTVKYETLSGSIKRVTFDNWSDAQDYADKKEQQPNIQWVDVVEGWDVK